MWKAALVTGGARRLGRAMALELARHGTDVAIHFNGSRDEAEAVASEAQSIGVKATVLQADLLDDDQVASLVDRAAAELGFLDVLVNNASIFDYDTIETATNESWHRHIDSNLKAPLFLTQAFARQVPEAERDDNGEMSARGVIVNMIDQRVQKLTPHFMTYTVAKFGLWGLTQTTARALAPRIRVNAIGPGPTLQGANQSSSHFDNQRRSTILQRGPDEQDICRALRFILESQSVTGQLFCVDGGQHLGWETPDIRGHENDTSG
jgi:NAD(P)-dependent dehydrogenase (short-subunit alcohol dehydrogenase family)